MKFCTKCGTQINDGDCFCIKCGTNLRTMFAETQSQLSSQQNNSQNNHYQAYQVQSGLLNSNSQVQTISTELSVGLNLVSLLIPVLGLILSIVFSEKRPLQASCCKANMILGFIISGICMTFSLILFTS